MNKDVQITTVPLRAGTIFLLSDQSNAHEEKIIPPFMCDDSFDGVEAIPTLHYSMMEPSYAFVRQGIQQNRVKFFVGYDIVSSPSIMPNM